MSIVYECVHMSSSSAVCCWVTRLHLLAARQFNKAVAVSEGCCFYHSPPGGKAFIISLTFLAAFKVVFAGF